MSMDTVAQLVMEVANTITDAKYQPRATTHRAMLTFTKFAPEGIRKPSDLAKIFIPLHVNVKETELQLLLDNFKEEDGRFNVSLFLDAAFPGQKPWIREQAHAYEPRGEDAIRARDEKRKQQLAEETRIMEEYKAERGQFGAVRTKRDDWEIISNRIVGDLTTHKEKTAHVVDVLYDPAINFHPITQHNAISHSNDTLAKSFKLQQAHRARINAGNPNFQEDVINPDKVKNHFKFNFMYKGKGIDPSRMRTKVSNLVKKL